MLVTIEFKKNLSPTVVECELIVLNPNVQMGFETHDIALCNSVNDDKTEVDAILVTSIKNIKSIRTNTTGSRLYKVYDINECKYVDDLMAEKIIPYNGFACGVSKYEDNYVINSVFNFDDYIVYEENDENIGLELSEHDEWDEYMEYIDLVERDEAKTWDELVEEYDI